MLLLIPLLPLIGFLINAALGRRISKPASGAVACGAIGASFLVALTTATTCGELGPHQMTFSPGPTPIEASRLASRFASASSWA